MKKGSTKSKGKVHRSGRVKRLLIGISAALVSIFFVLILSAYGYARQLGAASLDWSKFNWAHVEFDRNGIPTLEAKNWSDLIKAQGYVTAADRLWQMDLMRRAASGRLSEWFGSLPFAIKWDTKRKREDWMGVANRAEAGLPTDEKTACDNYAEGVNRFIAEHPWRVGIEYKLMGLAPERWRCRDALLILLSMAEDLSAAIDFDSLRTRWNRHLDSDWQAFLFPMEHPWNLPLFGKNSGKRLSLPEKKWIPMHPLSKGERSANLEVNDDESSSLGSNEWLWRGGGHYFLANDPHLASTVPQLWYQIRLRVSKKDWVVGCAIPGLPGVVLGRNRFIAWGFTNLFEDVDDLVEENLSPDGSQYEDPTPQGGTRWLPVEVRHFMIKVKGGADRTITANFTRRGPLYQYVDKDPKFYSRHWLAYEPGILRLPSLLLDRAMDWNSFNAALDNMRIPAQNVIFMDNVGNMGYRASGTGISRKVSGMAALPPGVGDWLGLEPATKRPRLYLPVDSHNPSTPSALGTANQRIYTGSIPHYWTSSQREERILSYLKTSKNFGREDMEKLQHDTYSRYHRELLQWIGDHAKVKNEPERRIIEKWKRWDGFAIQAPDVFAEALKAEEWLRRRLLERVKENFFPKDEQDLEYKHFNENAWMLAVLETKNGARWFGMEDDELAQSLLDSVAEKQKWLDVGYQNGNRWEAQHPFATIPVVGRIFRVANVPQFGHRDIVRVERILYSSAIRMIWDMSDPLASTWISPVGASGHALTPYFKNFQGPWFADVPIKVFPQNYDWGF